MIELAMSDFEDHVRSELTKIREMLDRYHTELFRSLAPLQNGDTPPVSVNAVVLTFPTVGVNGSTWALTQTQIEEWAGLFPGIAVEVECRHALAWVQAQPARRKSMSGMPRFLVGWLTRAQNQGPQRPANGHGEALTLTPAEAKEFEAHYRRMLGQYCKHEPTCEDQQACKQRQREAWLQARRGR